MVARTLLERVVPASTCNVVFVSGGGWDAGPGHQYISLENFLDFDNRHVGSFSLGVYAMAGLYIK